MDKDEFVKFPGNNNFEKLLRYTAPKVHAMCHIAPMLIEKIGADDAIAEEDKAEAFALGLIQTAYMNGLMDAARSERNLDISDWTYGLRLHLQAVLPDIQKGFAAVSEKLGDRLPNDRRN